MWYKLKDVSLQKRGRLQNPIPATILPFDSDDTNQRSLIVGEAGIVSADQTITVGTGTVSSRDWQKENYTAIGRLTPQLFLDYVKARKQYVTVTDANGNGSIDGPELTRDAINIVSGNFGLIDNAGIQGKAPFVLIVQGNVTININGNNVFNPPEKAVAILSTGTLKINSHHTEINGIFITNGVDFADDLPPGQWTTNPLKINGNLFSLTPVDVTKRQVADISKPSIFLVNRLYLHLGLWNLLSTRNYQVVEQNP